MEIRFDAVVDYLEDHAGRKLDANETLFLERQLESIESTLYKTKQKELKYRLHIPVSNRDNPGANTITYRVMTQVGMAKIISNNARDLPRSDAFMEEFTAKVKTIATSFGFDTQEVRAAVFNNMSLETIKGDSARRAVREKESNLAWNGDAQHNIIGIIGHPNVTELASPAGVSTTSPWGTKTPDEIIADISAMVAKVRSQSKGTQNANRLLLPIDQYTLIATTPRSTQSDTTILKFVLDEAAFGLDMIDWIPDELDLAFTSGSEDGAMCYEHDPEVLEQRIPLEIQILPVQRKGLEFEFPVEARNGGVVVRYPLGIVFMSGI
ncbi:DUF2184 domain-containing protein [Candidatus Pacearchaeota archaeon]|nr:DUF2184 domain-containing protein [Candidatus Pacearchaeota archaeon]